jgi:glycosyltransferase involved in cell wall biosynthesis
MSKKRILIFIDWFTPGFRAGGPITSCVNLVEHLKGEFDFSVITTDTDYMEMQPYKDVESDRWTVRPDGVRVYYFSTHQLTRSHMKKLVAGEKFDFIYLNGMFSRNFTLLPLKLLRKKNKEKIVLAARGMLAPSALKIKSAKKKFFLAYAKLSGLYSGITFQATSGQEAEDIQAVFGNVRIKLAPNLPENRKQTAYLKRPKAQGSVRLINVARIAPEKNLLYALRVLGQVKAQVVFDFYGPIYDHSYWKECLAQAKRLPANVSASYKGVLEPGKVGDTLAAYHFMFMPTRGENFGHIISQSFAAGTPAIISDQTPWRNLHESGRGYDLPLDAPAGFVKALEQAASLTQDQYDQLSSRLHSLANSHEGLAENLTLNRQLFA